MHHHAMNSFLVTLFSLIITVCNTSFALENNGLNRSDDDLAPSSSPDTASTSESIFENNERLDQQRARLFAACNAAVSLAEFADVLKETSDDVINRCQEQVLMIRNIFSGTYIEPTGQFSNPCWSALKIAFSEVTSGGDPKKVLLLCERGARGTPCNHRWNVHPLTCLEDCKKVPELAPKIILACQYLLENSELNTNRELKNYSGDASLPPLFWAAESRNPEILRVMTKKTSFDLALCPKMLGGKENILVYLARLFNSTNEEIAPDFAAFSARKKDTIRALSIVMASVKADASKDFYPEDEYEFKMLCHLLECSNEDQAIRPPVLAEAAIAGALVDLAKVYTLSDFNNVEDILPASADKALAVRAVWLIFELTSRGVNVMCPTIAEHDENFRKCRDFVLLAFVDTVRVPWDKRVQAHWQENPKLQREIATLAKLYGERPNTEVARLPFEIMVNIFLWLTCNNERLETIQLRREYFRNYRKRLGASVPQCPLQLPGCSIQ